VIVAVHLRQDATKRGHNVASVLRRGPTASTRDPPPRQGSHLNQPEPKCENCRKNMTGCDHGRPSCSFCLVNAIECKYRASTECGSCRIVKRSCHVVRPKCSYCAEKGIDCTYRHATREEQSCYTEQERQIIKVALFILGSILDCKMADDLDKDLDMLSTGSLARMTDTRGRLVDLVYSPLDKKLELFCTACKAERTLKDLLLNQETTSSCQCRKCGYTFQDQQDQDNLVEALFYWQQESPRQRSPTGSPKNGQPERGRKQVKSTYDSRASNCSPASSGHQEIIFD
jgi:hypothetical protein